MIYPTNSSKLRNRRAILTRCPKDIAATGFLGISSSLKRTPVYYSTLFDPVAEPDLVPWLDCCIQF